MRFRHLSRAPWSGMVTFFVCLMLFAVVASAAHSESIGDPIVQVKATDTTSRPG